MSKNQRGLWPARNLDFRIPSSFQIQNGCFCYFSQRRPIYMVGLTGLEPVTLRLSSACSNQLSYRPGSRFAPALAAAALLVEAWGFEPQTYSLQSYRSTN